MARKPQARTSYASVRMGRSYTSSLHRVAPVASFTTRTHDDLNLDVRPKQSKLVSTVEVCCLKAKAAGYVYVPMMFIFKNNKQEGVEAKVEDN